MQKTHVGQSEDVSKSFRRDIYLQGLLLSKAHPFARRPDRARRYVLRFTRSVLEPVGAAMDAAKLDGDLAAAYRAAMEAVQEAEKGDEDFDTIICGPWMTTWPLVHHNRHVERFLETNTKPLASA